MPLEVKTVTEKQPTTYRMFEWTGKEEDLIDAKKLLKTDCISLRCYPHSQPPTANALEFIPNGYDYYIWILPSYSVVISSQNDLAWYTTKEELLKDFQIAEGA